MAAIYQWFVGDEVVYTTTLYPIDVTEQLQLMASSHPGSYMYNFPVDSVQVVGVTPVYGDLPVLLLSGDTGEDSVQVTSVDPVFAEIVSLLATGDAGEDSAKIASVVPIEGELVDMLVICDTPDESLQLSCTTNAANSYLTPV